MRKNFEQELMALHGEIIELGSFVQHAVTQSIKAFKSHNLELCQEILDNDKIADDMEKRIESKCLWLIAREQPIAGDLRMITTALKIATDMERIGDHAADIAELCLSVAQPNPLAQSANITAMAQAAVCMVRNAVRSYVNADLALAKATEQSDDEVDDYFDMIKQELAEVFRRCSGDIDRAIDLLLIAKYLERIADHAVNICEWVYFSQTGQHKNRLIF